MKSRVRQLLLALIIFLCSSLITIWGWIEIIDYIPEINNPIVKADITKSELFFIFLGQDIPSEKDKKFNDITGKPFNSNNNSEKFNIITNFIIMPSAILTSIVLIIYYCVITRIERKKRIREDKLLKDNYFTKYPIREKALYAKCIESGTYNEVLMNKHLMLWIDQGSINIINSNYKNDIGKFQISIEQIVFYSRYGDFYTTTHINGGNSSYGKAALGYLVAGSAGAIIASREPVSGTTIVHDKRETLIVFKDDSIEKYLFFEPKLYDYLMHYMPTKEIAHKIDKLKVQDEDKFQKLIKIGELKDKGLISDVEFEKLKSELINT
ncbi:MAG: hypothetical protein APF77_12415 [Clostridia bacterium BRH_c25]|nr:MAG: hypothetical protein APF77_12415 [Clostridia bacterium BRH_c25]